ncbi:hypothetical protein GGF32_005285 [Allomyces javanicus]|nr:hypothetical protein GGF32_005285 [Allomyces javanicus]
MAVPMLHTNGTGINRSSTMTGSSSTSSATPSLRPTPLDSRWTTTPVSPTMINAGTSQNDASDATEPTRPRLALFLLDKSLPDVWTYATKEHPGLAPPKDVIHVVFMTEASRPTSMDLTRLRYTVRGPAGVYWPGLDAPHTVHGTVDDALHAVLHPKTTEEASQLVVVGTRNRREVLEAAFHLARGLEPAQVALVCWPRDVDWSIHEWADRCGLFGNGSPQYKQFSTNDLIAHWKQTLEPDQRQNLQLAVSYVTKTLDKRPNGPLTADAYHALLSTPWTVPIDRNLVFSHLLHSKPAPAFDFEYWGLIECVAEFPSVLRQSTGSATLRGAPPTSAPQRISADFGLSTKLPAATQHPTSLQNTFSMLDEELEMFLSLDLTGNAAHSSATSTINHADFTASPLTATARGSARSTDPVPDLTAFFDQVLADIYDRTGRPDLPLSPVDLAAEFFEPDTTASEIADLLGDPELPVLRTAEVFPPFVPALVSSRTDEIVDLVGGPTSPISRTAESSPLFAPTSESSRAAEIAELLGGPGSSVARTADFSPPVVPTRQRSRTSEIADLVGDPVNSVSRTAESSPLFVHAPESSRDADSPARSARSWMMVLDGETASPRDQGTAPVVPSVGSSRGAPIARGSGRDGGEDSVSSFEEFDSESTSGDERGEVGEGVEAHDGDQHGISPSSRPVRQWRPGPVPVPRSDEPWRVVPKPRAVVQAPAGDDSHELLALAKMHAAMMEDEKTQYKSAWLGKPLRKKKKKLSMELGKF